MRFSTFMLCSESWSFWWASSSFSTRLSSFSWDSWSLRMSLLVRFLMVFSAWISFSLSLIYYCSSDLTCFSSCIRYYFSILKSFCINLTAWSSAEPLLESPFSANYALIFLFSFFNSLRTSCYCAIPWLLDRFASWCESTTSSKSDIDLSWRSHFCFNRAICFLYSLAATLFWSVAFFCSSSFILTWFCATFNLFSYSCILPSKSEFLLLYIVLCLSISASFRIILVSRLVTCWLSLILLASISLMVSVFYSISWFSDDFRVLTSFSATLRRSFWRVIWLELCAYIWLKKSEQICVCLSRMYLLMNVCTSRLSLRSYL